MNTPQPPLSQRILRVKPSPTLAVSAKAALLKSQGKDIISLGVGEPDFDTPEHIKWAAKTAIDQGFTKYTAVEGIIELRQAISDKFAQDNQLKYSPKQILVSNGAKQSFYNLAQVLLNEGDEVIIPAPYWVSYPDMVLLADAKPVFVFAGHEQSFKISAVQLESAITPRTRLIVLNSPSNPTGMAYSVAEWRALGEMLRKYPNIFIASDDMYEYIYWKKERFSNILMSCPDLYDRTVLLHGVSKTYAMTGWRIGFAAGPQHIIDAMNTLQSQSTSNACSISQKASVAALTGDQDCVRKMVQAFKERHDFLMEALNSISGVVCQPNDGTFYAFPYVQGLIDMLGQEKQKGSIKRGAEKGQDKGAETEKDANVTDITDDISLAEFLLQEANVALVPGSAFGAPGYLRLSFATSLEKLKEAVERIKKSIENRVNG